MTEPNFRALCQELMDEAIYLGSLPYEQDLDPDLIERARAALAQPEPQGLTDEELCKFFRANDDLMRHFEAGTDWDEPLMAEYEFPAVARAVLARCGRPAIEPVPLTPDAAFAIGQTGGPPSEAERLAFEAWMRGHSWLVAGKWNGTTYADPQERHSSVDVPAMQTRMLWAAWRDRAALGRPAIEPVPVSERLPGPEDCDAEGRCWWWNVTMDPDSPNWWSFESTEYIETEPYWLPYWALPVPRS